MRTRSVRTVVAVALTAAIVAVFAAPGGASHADAKKPPTTAGFDGKTINLGVITPLSGLVSIIGKPLSAGNQMWWDYYNDAKGGIAGKYKVKLTTEDSAYAPATAVQAYDKIKGDVVAFQQILGTQITKALLPKMLADQAVGAPATLDATWVHNPNLVPIAAPYQVEAINALDYYVKNGGKGKKVCALAQDDEFGQAGLEGFSGAKKALKLKTGPSPRFKTGEDLTAQIQQLSDAKCDAVLVVATAADANAVAAKSISLNFSPQYIALAPFWLPTFAKSANISQFLVDHLWLASSQFAGFGDASIPGMSTFLQRQQKYAPSQAADGYFVFGYLQGQAMAQVLEQAAKNGDFSRAGILKAVSQIKKLTFENLDDPYTYGPAAKRNPPRGTALFKVDPSKAVGISILSPQAASPAATKYKIK
jgi:ABC-type branched-subunit amino acid transport system substrate-binding protein